MSVFFLEQGVSANEKSFFVCHNINKAPKVCCFSTLKLCSIGFSLYLHSLFGIKVFLRYFMCEKSYFSCSCHHFELLIINSE